MEGCSGFSDPEEMQASPETNPCTPDEESVSSRDSSNDEASGFDVPSDEIQQIQKTQDHLKKSLEILKTNYQREYTVIMEVLDEDKLRWCMLTLILWQIQILSDSQWWVLQVWLFKTRTRWLDRTAQEGDLEFERRVNQH